MEPKSATRHYEIDALRVIALFLLILYHIFVCYQPFAEVLNFLRYDQLLEEWWFLGDLLNVWRIPVLFVISGMALGFVLRRRTVKELYIDRMIRLVPPLIFGALVIFPIFPALFALYKGNPIRYFPSPGHLWFLQNLVSYTILMLPLVFWIKKRPENFLIRSIRATMPFGLLVLLPVPLMLETMLFQPEGFAFFPMRFWYGLVCYAAGFILISTGEKFWSSLRFVCHIALPLAFLFYLGRMGKLDWGLLRPSHGATGFESGLWMLAFLGYGSLFLNRPSKTFAYLNKAVFPIYIIHMPIQQLVSYVIYRWKLAPEITFFLHVLFTLGLCWLLYEFVIRRIRLLYPVMGLVSPKANEGRWVRLKTVFTSYILGPLIFLAQIGMIAAMLLGGIAKMHSPERTKSDTLWAAAKNNDEEALSRFLAKDELEIDQLQPKTKLTALNWASLNGNTEAVRQLIEAGAEVNRRTADGSTALGHAAFMGHPETVAILLAHGAKVNPVNQYQATPLDSTYADWSIVIGVARALDLTVNKEAWEKGKLEVRELLQKNGGKHKTEL